jgi:hypothetical protein
MSNPQSNRRILILVTHSIGELDVVFPLLSRLDKGLRSEVELVFVVKEIYRTFLENHFYRHCVDRFNISVSFNHFPNKFDYKGTWLRNTLFGRVLFRFFSAIVEIKAACFLRRQLQHTVVLMHETTNQLSGSKQLQRAIDRWIGKRIVYHHGHSLNQLTRERPTPYYGAAGALYLIFTSSHQQWGEDKGYVNQLVIGFPKLYSEWIETMWAYSNSHFSPTQDQFLLIYSRPISDIYMDSDKYRSLFVDSYQVTRQVFGDIPIVIKPHPRENELEIEKVIREENLTHITICNEHAGILASNAKLALSFWTSCIFDSLSLEVPTIEYYKEARRFRENEPMGSPYKVAGIDSASSSEDLRHFMITVKNGRYHLPEVLTEWKRESQFNEFGKILEDALAASAVQIPHKSLFGR